MSVKEAVRQAQSNTEVERRQAHAAWRAANSRVGQLEAERAKAQAALAESDPVHVARAEREAAFARLQELEQQAKRERVEPLVAQARQLIEELAKRLGEAAMVNEQLHSVMVEVDRLTALGSGLPRLGGLPYDCSWPELRPGGRLYYWRMNAIADGLLVSDEPPPPKARVLEVNSPEAITCRLDALQAEGRADEAEAIRKQRERRARAEMQSQKPERLAQAAKPIERPWDAALAGWR